MSQKLATVTTPYFWVPTLYFGEGLSYTIVALVAELVYKVSGLPNAQIALCVSLLTLPWMLKPLLAPIIELFATQRRWIVQLHKILAALCLFIALIIPSSYFWSLSLPGFAAIATCGTLYDIATDGFYLRALLHKQQSLFVGLRSVAYNLAKLLAHGGVVALVGYIAIWRHDNTFAWRTGFVIYAVFFMLLATYHARVLPYAMQPIAATPHQKCAIKIIKIKLLLLNFCQVFHSSLQDFLRIPKVVYVLIFILFYNAAEAQIIKIVPLFFLDTLANGGMNFGVAKVGWVCGIVGVSAVLLGISIGSWLVEKFTLQRCLIPLTFVMLIANSAYWLLSTGNKQHISFLVVSAIHGLAQFSCGLCNSAYMIFLLLLVKEQRYRTSQYALATTLMACGLIIFGAFSGYLQKFLGYNNFFIWIIMLYSLIFAYTVLMVKRWTKKS